MSAPAAARPPLGAADVRRVLAIERPAPSLMRYYTFASLVAGPLFPVLLVYLYFRYHTMRYRFDEQGVHMQWGILFRRQVTLSYARIQDIHLTSNVLERWLDLAQVKLSTASGSASAEMVIEGLHEFELVRDFLYAHMRGSHEAGDGAAVAAGTVSPAHLQPVMDALRQVSEDLRAVRAALERRPPSP